MKQLIVIFVLMISVVVAFWAGRLTGPGMNVNNADGILAYQHYYECAEKALQDVTITDAELAKDYDLAKSQLDEYHAGHVMTWPEICDQRDQLSDIIRKYSDEENNNIMAYVSEYFNDPSILSNWRYSY